MINLIGYIGIKNDLILFLLAVFILTSGFNSKQNTDWLNWTNNCLKKNYNSSTEPKLTKWELSINDLGFIRLRKFYKKNKQIYYSLNLKKLKDIKFDGTSKNGILRLITNEDDIIVQIHNSRKGDVDEMSNVLSLPLRNLTSVKIDSLMQGLKYFRDK